MNAHTTREETAYYARVLPEDTGLALDVISDMLQRSVFNAKELEREKQVIIQEIGRDLDSPEDHLYDLLHTKAYPGQRFGRPILGSVKVIARTPRTALVEYVKRHYNTSTMVVVAAGRIEHDNFVALVKKYFTKVPSGKMPRREKAHIKPGPVSLEKEIEQMHVIMGFAGDGYHAKTHAANQVLATLLGGSASSRLFQKIREKRGLVYTVNAHHAAYSDSGIFQVYAGTDPERVDELIPAICREMVDVTKNVTEGELKRAKSQICAEIRMGRENVMRRADVLGHHMLAFGHSIAPEKTLQRYGAVTKDAVENVARRLAKKPPILAALGPLQKLEAYSMTVARLRT